VIPAFARDTRGSDTLGPAHRFASLAPA